MLDAALYPKNNSLQVRDASCVVDNYFHLLNWHNCENILDIGTGDGTVLLDIVFPKIPKNFKKLVALDIDPEMLDLAKDTLKNHPEIVFYCGDIAATPTPTDLVRNFNHIFSFYCLHFVEDQSKLMKILFNLLKPGGEMLFTIIDRYMAFDVYHKLAEMDEWKPYYTSVKKIGLYPFQHSPDAVKEMKQYLEDAGFVQNKCELIDFQFTHQYEEFLEFVASIDPFIEQIPDEELSRYREDHMKEVKKHKDVAIEYKDGKEISVTVSYKALVVFASKSS